MCAAGQTYCRPCSRLCSTRRDGSGAVRCDQRRGGRVAAGRGVPEPGVLDPGDQFWLEAMADAVLILSPVYGARRQVTDFRVDYANAAADELADDPTPQRLRRGSLIGAGF